MATAKIAIYLLLTAVLVLALNAYIASAEMYQKQTAKIDANFSLLESKQKSNSNGTPQLLVIGNSYVEASFLPGDNSDAITLFTVAGMPMADILAIVEQLPPDTTIDTILVGLGYNYATPASGVSTVYDVHLDQNPVRRLWNSIPLVRGRSISATVLKVDAKCLLSRGRRAPCSAKKADLAKAAKAVVTAGNANDADLHRKKILQSVNTRYREYLPFTSQLDSSFATYLHRLQQLCQQRNIRLRAYTAPVFHALRARLPEAVLDQFRATVAAAGIDYVDMNLVFPDWDAGMFFDATHVEKSTAGKTTTEYLLGFSNAGLPDQARSGTHGP